MEMDVWHGYQSGSLHDCRKISLSDPFFVVTVPLRKLKSCGRKLMVIQKYKRLGSQFFLTGCQWTIRTKTKYRNIWCGGANRRGCASADCGIQTVFLKKCTLTMWNSRAPLKTRIVLIHSSILFTYPVTIIPGGSHLDQLTDPLFTTLGRCAQITK